MDALTRIIQRRVRYDKRRKKILTGISYDLGNMSVEYLSEKDGEKMREAIKTLEQEPCDVPDTNDGKLSEIPTGSEKVRDNMADIELIIKIPKEIYESNKRECEENDALIIDTFTLAIGNGTPLPKGHGRLIDADAFERRCMFDSDIEDMQDVIYALRDYKSIIEADKESEDKK